MEAKNEAPDKHSRVVVRSLIFGLHNGRQNWVLSDLLSEARVQKERGKLEREIIKIVGYAEPHFTLLL